MSSDCLGSMMEGAIAIGEDGKILGANRAGFSMLGLRPADIGTRDAAACFDMTFPALLISVSHTDIPHRIGAKTFQSDLYYRLNGLSVSLPPLRDRTDMPALIERILAQETTLHEATAQGRRAVTLSAELGLACARYAWPGNLRQLAGWLRTACLMLDDGEEVITLAHLSEEARHELSAKPARLMEPASATLRAQSDAMIAGAVEEAGGNIAAAARHLGISRNTLYRRLAVLQGH